MKQTYIFCLLFVSLFSSAQIIITFPDANFKAKLLAADVTNTIALGLSNTYVKIDANNNGEIEQSEAAFIKNLKIQNSNISDLEGLVYFTNLENLYCNNNPITSLDIGYNGDFTDLKTLNCSNCQLTSINIQNLSALQYLYLDNNLLTNLTFNSNSSLSIISCKNNQLTSLDLTETIVTDLNCYNNSINNIIFNSGGCSRIFLGKNNLTSLSLNFQYPQVLQYIDISDNPISNFDFSPYTSLIYAGIGNNQMTSIDLLNLPISLERLYITGNNISSLDFSNASFTILDLTLENMSNLSNVNLKEGFNFELYGLNNTSDFPFQITNCPNLQYICVDEGELDFFNQRLMELNLLNQIQFNSYCSFTLGGEYYTIQGQQKFDSENDGCTVTDNFFPNFKYTISNGTTTGSIISNNSGNYSIPVQAGSHTITPVFENPSYFTVSQSNVVVNFPTQTSPFTQDFCIAPNGTKHDVEVSIIATNSARPGFDANYKIIYKNKGNQTENGTITLQFDDVVLDLVSVNPAITTQTLNNLNWTYSNLQPFETREINVVFNVNSPLETPAVNAGDFLIYIAEITSLGVDEISIDNTFGLKQIVVNSFDPNDKTCLQGNYVGPDKIGNYVHYVIRFENTGTFPAENIVVKDMIDADKFDVSSLVPLHASHNYVTKITDNKVEFVFENINLPFDDANNDGYVAFKIKTVPTLVVGNTFSNTANIYFDYNFPIVTNTATTTIAALSNPSFEFANYFSLYPNPTTNELNINLKSAIEINSIQIYNTIGQLVTIQTGSALKVDVSNLKTGNYFIKVNTNEGFSTSQFIKE